MSRSAAGRGYPFAASASEYERATIRNPIHVAYSLYEKAHPGWEFRPSWDQMGVYIAARKNDPLFTIDSSGSVTAKKHFIIWNESPDKNHFWFQNNSTREERRKIIEGLMMHEPE